MSSDWKMLLWKISFSFICKEKRGAEKFFYEAKWSKTFLFASSRLNGTSSSFWLSGILSLDFPSILPVIVIVTSLYSHLVLQQFQRHDSDTLHSNLPWEENKSLCPLQQFPPLSVPGCRCWWQKETTEALRKVWLIHSEVQILSVKLDKILFIVGRETGIHYIF